MSSWSCPSCSLVTDEAVSIEPHVLVCCPLGVAARWPCGVCGLRSASFDDLAQHCLAKAHAPDPAVATHLGPLALHLLATFQAGFCPATEDDGRRKSQEPPPSDYGVSRPSTISAVASEVLRRGKRRAVKSIHKAVVKRPAPPPEVFTLSDSEEEAPRSSGTQVQMETETEVGADTETGTQAPAPDIASILAADSLAAGAQPMELLDDNEADYDDEALAEAPASPDAKTSAPQPSDPACESMVPESLLSQQKTEPRRLAAGAQLLKALLGPAGLKRAQSEVLSFDPKAYTLVFQLRPGTLELLKFAVGAVGKSCGQALSPSPSNDDEGGSFACAQSPGCPASLRAKRDKDGEGQDLWTLRFHTRHQH